MIILDKPIWISFEGGEGCGKTSLMKILEKDFIEKNIDTILTREPGGVLIAEKIRDIILDKKNIQMDKITEALLYAASRRQHLVEKVLPALEKGKSVLMDRYVDSSIAYQGYARKIGIDKVRDINKFAIDGNYPDITFFIDLDPLIGMKRIEDNNREMNRLDLEKIDFHRDVRKAYHMIAKDSERIIIIDGDRSIDEVYKDIYNRIEERFFYNRT